MATIEDFEKLDIRVGRIIEVEDFPAKKPNLYKLRIDFGKDIGIKTSIAQLAALYKKEELKGKLILGVVNFPPRQIGPSKSEALTLGVPDQKGNPVLIQPEREVEIGGRLY